MIYKLTLYSQAEVNIIAGCCMSLGFRFAGTNDQDAFKTLVCIYVCMYIHIYMYTTKFRIVFELYAL